MKVLVTGGAGYIGSHVVRSLLQRGHEPVVLDDLRQGHASAVTHVPLVRAEVADRGALEEAFHVHRFRSVVHLAADCLVGESMEQPGLYYRNNVIDPLGMLETLRHLGVQEFVLSSSAAVYGDPAEVPIPEAHPCRPTNPYGETKLALERALEWYGVAHGLRAISLRYFNAAGASGELGEDHHPETHLIPRMLMAALGGGPDLTIHGDDFPTPDGTCVRDYIHVEDLAEAHVLALEALAAGQDGGAYNLGTERGHSVREVLEAAREVTGRPIAAHVGPRRPGDPPTLVASSRRARDRFGWSPRRSDLRQILQSAWEWHRRQPEGYGTRGPAS